MIRIATPDDIPAILNIYAPYVENTTCSFEYAPPTLEAFRERFMGITEQFPWLVWEENGQVQGYAYGSLPFKRTAYCWDCEVSIYLKPECHGKGIGRKLYAVLEDILIKQGYRVIYALITSENRGSLDFHEKVGYKTVATLPDCGVKFGRWLGVIWMEKRVEFPAIPSKPPVSWRKLVENNGNFSNILATLSLS